MPIFGFLLSSTLFPHPSSLNAGLFLSGTLIRMNDLLCTNHVCFPFINLLFSIAYDKIIRCDKHSGGCCWWWENYCSTFNTAAPAFESGFTIPRPIIFAPAAVSFQVLWFNSLGHSRPVITGAFKTSWSKCFWDVMAPIHYKRVVSPPPPHPLPYYNARWHYLQSSDLHLLKPTYPLDPHLVHKC